MCSPFPDISDWHVTEFVAGGVDCMYSVLCACLGMRAFSVLRWLVCMNCACVRARMCLCVHAHAHPLVVVR